MTALTAVPEARLEAARRYTQDLPLFMFLAICVCTTTGLPACTQYATLALFQRSHYHVHISFNNKISSMLDRAGNLRLGGLQRLMLLLLSAKLYVGFGYW